MTNGNGMEVTITNYGGRIVSILAADRAGKVGPHDGGPPVQRFFPGGGGRCLLLGPVQQLVERLDVGVQQAGDDVLLVVAGIEG